MTDPWDTEREVADPDDKCPAGCDCGMRGCPLEIEAIERETADLESQEAGEEVAAD